MANYPFRINMKSKLGTNDLAWYTGSLATDADSQISASVMVDRINNIPSASYEDGVATPSGTSVHLFGGGRNLFMSCSHTDANIGAIEFHDEENTVGGGLEYYTFWGAKVCSVLGLPEGIPIYTENFKLSDDSNDPGNYISGDIIAGGLSVKDSLKLSPQARVRSNLVWDEEFGEGLVQWVSGSTGKLLMGYDNVTDKYKISAAGASTFEISGVDNITATELDGNVNMGTLDGYVKGGTVNILANNRTTFDITDNEAQLRMDNNNQNTMVGGLYIRDNISSTWSNSLIASQYALALTNRHGDNTGDFAGICFDVATTDVNGLGEDSIQQQALGAAIIAERDSSANGSTTLYDTNLSFATNDAAISGITKRMTITHNGLVGINETDPDATLEVNGDIHIIDDLFVDDFARIDALRVGNESTDPGDGNLYVEDYIYAPGLGTGVDNSVVILDSDNRLKTDEIDSRVWGTTLLDGTNGSNNEIAIFTDSNSVEGVTNLTYDNQTLSVGVDDSLPRLYLNSTSTGDNWTAQGAHISIGESAGGAASLDLTYTGDGYGRIGMGTVSNGIPPYGEIKFYYAADRIEIPSADVEIHNALSIGHTGTPAGTLDVRSSSDTYMGIFRNTTSTDGDNSYILNLWHSQEDSTSDFDTSEHWIQFSDNSGTFLGEIIDEVTYSTFTGGHVSQIISGSATDNENEMKAWKPGMILKATGNLNVTGSTIGLAWPEVTVTTAEKDKAVMGVYNDIKPGSGSNWVGVYNNKNAVSSSTGDWGIGHNMHGLDPVKPALDYNAVGEGKILVTDTNGNIETGDYICSSTRTGHGEKQDDDLLHNYTVAKATQPMDFSTKPVDSDLGYKSVLIACTYHCG